MAFTTLKELFEPMVIFFGLTNSLVTFQMMINEILWDLINTGEVVSFIDNIIVEMEEKEEYNKVVKEVVRKLAENNLYIKLEKYKWKVRKVEFLEVIIGPECIKIEQEKVKRVLDWPTLKRVKDIHKFLRLAQLLSVVYEELHSNSQTFT